MPCFAPQHLRAGPCPTAAKGCTRALGHLGRPVYLRSPVSCQRRRHSLWLSCPQRLGLLVQASQAGAPGGSSQPPEEPSGSSADAHPSGDPTPQQNPSGSAPSEPQDPRPSAGSDAAPQSPSTSGAGGAGSGGGYAASAGGAGGGAAPGAISLGRRMPGVGYTFLLAGVLKIMTLGGLAVSAPNEATRTAVGKVSSYMLVPVGVGLAWLAKFVVDSGLNESKRFIRGLVVVLIIAYFGLVKVLFTYRPAAEVVSRPRSRLPGPLGEVRSQLGDKELAVGGSMMGAGAAMADSRAYQVERPDKDMHMYDDVAWYEGRYPSQMREAAAERPGAPGARRLNADIEVDEGRLDDVEELLAARGRAARPARGPTRRSYLSNNVNGDDGY